MKVAPDLLRPNRKAAHVEPIYFVGLEQTAARLVLITNTASSSNQTGADGYPLQADGYPLQADGYPLQYAQRINTQTGACVCGCKGFSESIAPRADRDGVTPTIHNSRTCKHIRKAAESGREWGYLDAEAPAAEPAKAEARGFDSFAFFEGA